MILVLALGSFYAIRARRATNARAEARYTRRSHFIDISSPQCDRLDSINRRDFGIVGLNGTGLNYRVNPCLNREIAKFNHYDLYVGANYPSQGCRDRGITTPYACGSDVAAFDLYLIVYNHYHPGAIWIDIEENSEGNLFGSSQSDNREFIKGMRDKFRQNGRRVGVYSNSGMWSTITGNWHHDSMNWYATGRRNAGDARRYCNNGFGGESNNVYVQYVNGNQDHNEGC